MPSSGDDSCGRSFGIVVVAGAGAAGSVGPHQDFLIPLGGCERYAAVKGRLAREAALQNVDAMVACNTQPSLSFLAS